MSNSYIESTQMRHGPLRSYSTIVAFIVFGFSLGAYLMYMGNHLLESPLIVQKEKMIREEIAGGSSPSSAKSPLRIRIPSISIDTTFEAPLGLNEDKTIMVPTSYEKVGWYEYGAIPGETGTASILGHLDSKSGPAVFYELGRLSKGDRIIITRENDTEAEFEVEYTEQYRQEDFPTEQVYAPTPYPSLRLITCSGSYLKGEQRYTHNLVVYARLVEPSDGTIL